jgi:hypothetical protein
MTKTHIDIIREKRYGKKGYNVVVWKFIGGLPYITSGWVEKGSLLKLYPKSKYKYDYLDKPHGHFGIPYNTKTKKWVYEKW